MNTDKITGDIELSFSLKMRDFIKMSLRSEYLYTGRLLKFIPLYLVLAGLILYSNVKGNGAVLIPAVIVMMLIIPVVIVVNFYRSVIKDYRAYHGGNSKFIISDRGIDSVTAAGEAFCGWESICKVIADKDAYYFFINSYFCFFLPKNAISPGDSDILTAFFQDNPEDIIFIKKI